MSGYSRFLLLEFLQVLAALTVSAHTLLHDDGISLCLILCADATARTADRRERLETRIVIVSRTKSAKWFNDGWV